MTSTQAELAPGRGPVVFDFDGPICSVFAGIAAPSVARKLRRLVIELDAALADRLDPTDDPLELLGRVGAARQHDLLVSVEDALIQEELTAVETADPTPGAHQLIHLVNDSGRPVAIASINSGPAIHKYLRLHGLTNAVAAVAGRAPYEPWLMKPDPNCLVRATAHLNASPSECIFIGDSTADVAAGRAICIPVIGYAKDDLKAHALRLAGATRVVSAMDALALILVT